MLDNQAVCPLYVAMLDQRAALRPSAVPTPDTVLVHCVPAFNFLSSVHQPVVNSTPWKKEELGLWSRQLPNSIPPLCFTLQPPPLSYA